jgi:tellurite resistance protein TehA-like permease
MHLTLLPKTKLGKWSLGLIIAGLVLYGIFFIVVSLGYRGGETFGIKDVIPASPMILMVLAAIASMVVGIISVIKSKERSIIVFITIVIGLFALALVVGEFVVPH